LVAGCVAQKVPDPFFPSRRFATDLAVSIQAACQWLSERPPPPVLATEHLLLGLVLVEHDVSTWLRSCGLDPVALAAEIDRIHGYQSGPLAADLSEPAISPARPTGATAGLSSSVLGTAGQTGHRPNVGHGTHAEARKDSPPPMETAVLRVLDAACNRAREGLRVIEDFLRFVLDDRHLSGECKNLRHDFSAALGQIPPAFRLAARETLEDVGAGLSTPTELRRADMAEVLAANFARLQESLRNLEEFGKLLDADMAAKVEQLRYRAYTLQRAAEITRHSAERLAHVRLYVLIPGGSSAEEFERLARPLIAAGVHALQLRDKQLGDRQLVERARLLRAWTRGTDTLLIINDRPDVAVLCQADGVHVGQEELSVKDARAIVGPEALVGVSTHTIQQARQAVLAGANYIGVGPTFPSGTKPFASFPGVDLLRAVAAEIRLPAFAIGGISRQNLPQVLATGIGRLAVSGAISQAADPAAEVKAFLEEMG
jgi:thiamine-phosphate pyrophosphorylase